MGTTMPENRDNTGQYEQSYSDDQFVDAVRELGPGVGTQDIADDVGCNRDTAYRRLRKLEEDERIESRKVGMARLWEVGDGT